MAMNERDIALVTQAIEGDSKAFEGLYTQYYNKIFALARVTVKNEADAEIYFNKYLLTHGEIYRT